jgi:hypothetical protein
MNPWRKTSPELAEMSFLREIQEALLQPTCEINPLLLKLRLLAARLGNGVLEEWVRYESEGYPPGADCPIIVSSVFHTLEASAVRSGRAYRTRQYRLFLSRNLPANDGRLTNAARASQQSMI